MQISFNGIESLKQLEGFESKAYKDTGGVWTIGYGTIRWLDKPVEAGQTITEKEAVLALQADLAWAQTAVNQLVRCSLKQNEFDALVSFVYNVGESAFAKSTMLRLLNQQRKKEAAAQFQRWVYGNGKIVKGLVNRRIQERRMFEGI
jgi:lysozyme